EYLDDRVKILGKLPNEEAISFMKTVDIVALPTYYPFEAFPISILEAMSLSKLVISTSRAAIKDMLTTEDGDNCGILVREKSVDDLVNAINWCVVNPLEANTICKKAYKKVFDAYRTDVVYEIYEKNYKKLF
ncbi:MAG: glycosyltransferase family 4 protein, partial [Flavobacteriaceae bacterium]|nr:glycosyltransferase family 4 protein [Flavobacteriaceae bacterium]